MLFALGLFLTIFPIIFIIINNKKVFTRKVMLLQDIFLIVLSFFFLFLCFIVNTEPFAFKLTSSIDYLIATAVIFIFSPFLWLVVYFFTRKIYRKYRVFKNSRLKSKEEYIYYRDDLNKVSPSILMFTSLMENDIKKSVGATILKLKLSKCIIEEKGKLKYNNNIPLNNNLLETDKIVINFIENNRFDEKKYKEYIEKEAIEQDYVKKNSKHKIVKLLKIFITLCMPVVLIFSSINYDKYIFHKYETPVLNDIKYIKLTNDNLIERLYNDKIINPNDYYHSTYEIFGQKRVSYSYNLIRADRYQYSVVRVRTLIELSDVLFLFLSIISISIAIFLVIEQIKYFNKNYVRTPKGNQLLSKAYALKNFLKDFSIINQRSYEELNMWEYYLIYALVLDVNTNIQDDLLKKYLTNL